MDEIKIGSIVTQSAWFISMNPNIDIFKRKVVDIDKENGIAHLDDDILVFTSNVGKEIRTKMVTLQSLELIIKEKRRNKLRRLNLLIKKRDK
jgi:hypothetical protein